MSDRVIVGGRSGQVQIYDEILVIGYKSTISSSPESSYFGELYDQWCGKFIAIGDANCQMITSENYICIIGRFSLGTKRLHYSRY